MVQAVKITSLNDIGTGIMYTTLVPVVNMTGIPTTEKANLQIVGNLILTGAGGSYFPPAAQATVSQFVAYAAQPNITSVGTLTSLDVLGNIIAGNANLGNLAIANVFSGTLNGSAVSANTANTVVANAQPNITSLGTLTSLNVTGLANLGAVTSLTITGGSPNYVLKTDGFGTLSWVAQSGGGSGNTGNITFEDANISTDLLNTDVQIIGNGTGNVNVVANNQTWLFNADGNLTLPAGGIISDFDAGSGANSIGTSLNGLEYSQLYWNGNVGNGNPFTGSDLYSWAFVDNSGFRVAHKDYANSVNYIWTFDNNGNLTLPSDLQFYTPPMVGGTGILQDNLPLMISATGLDGRVNIGWSQDGGNIAFMDFNSSPENVQINTGNLNSIGYIWTFDNVGNLTLPGNTFSVNYANGDPVQIGGGGNANTGNITFSAANISTDLLNTDIQIIGNGTGDVNVVANSQVWTFGADGNLTIPNAHGNIGSVYNNGIDIVAPIGGYAELASGNLNNFIYVEDNGAYINTDRNGVQYQWEFDTTGNLILPDTSSIIAAAGISIQANSTGNTTGLGLNGDADAFLYAHANIIINTDVNGTGNTWIFGTDGTTQFPGNTILVPEGKPLEIKTTDGNVYSTLTTDASGGYASVGLQDNDTGANPAWAYVETDMSDVNDPSAVVILKPGDTGTEVRWTFTADGNLTTPGNIIVDVAGDAIIGSSSNVNVSAGGNTWTFGTDGALQVPSNVISPRPGTIASANGYPSLLAYGSGGGFGIHGGPELDWMNADDPANSFSNVNTLRNTVYLNATGFYIGMNENSVVGNTTASWLFTPSGNLRLPDNGLIWNNGGLTTLQAGTDAAQIGSNDGQSYVIANANGTYMQTLADTTNSLWHFGTDGNTSFPAVGTANLGNLAIANNFSTNGSGGDITLTGGNITGANVISANTFLGTGNLHLQPNPANTDAYLDVYLTTGPDIHIAGNGENLILGSDTGANVMLGASGNVTIQSNTGTPHIWTFGSDGNLTLPYGAVIKDTVSNAVSFGQAAGLTLQKRFAVAVGWSAGSNTQGNNSVAVGPAAGYDTQGLFSVAVGDSAGANTQSSQAIAIGASAGQNVQGFCSIAIGSSAGFNNQGNYAVAIGTFAGTTSQASNSIILNATSANLDQTTANTFTVAPIRNDTSNIAEVMFYNTASKEVTYGNTISIAGNITAGNIVTGTGTTGNITGANVIAANTFQSTVVAFSSLPPATTPGLRAFINNGNLVAVGNFGAQVAGGGANYVPVFSDGANWCIG
jgi:hypothetical protein